MFCGGQIIRPSNAVQKSGTAAVRDPGAPSDEQVVKGAFEAHLKGNPKLSFSNKWKNVTVSKGKRSDKNWTSDEYSIRDNGKNEYVLRHTRSHYKPSVKSMNWLDHKTRYYHIKVSVLPNGKQKYDVAKYKMFFRQRVRNLSFVADTKAGRVLTPESRKVAAASKKLVAPQIKRFSCSITSVNKNTLLGKDIMHSKSYRAAVLTNKGLYHMRATFDAGSRKYFITHSRKWGSNWTRHGRYRSAPSHITKMFNYACRQYIKADLRK